MSLPPALKIDPGVVALYEARAEDRYYAAVRRRLHSDVSAVLFHRSRGMTRRRLIEIYGAELVNMAIAEAEPSEGVKRWG